MSDDLITPLLPPDGPDESTRSEPLVAGGRVPRSRNAAIQELLAIVAGNNIQVSDRLLRNITGEEPAELGERRSAPAAAGRESVLGALFKEHQESILSKASNPDDVETAVAREIRDKLEGLKHSEGTNFNVRVRDGSYTVTVPVKGGGNAKEEAGTQHITTVTNAGALYKFKEALQRLFASGSARRETERKIIMQGVNLVLEEGKMYLILGAPGCGKSVREFQWLCCVLRIRVALIDRIFVCDLSFFFRMGCMTVLKMIANMLPRDKNNHVGGTVTVNGVESTDKNVVWSVSPNTV